MWIVRYGSEVSSRLTQRWQHLLQVIQRDTFKARENELRDVGARMRFKFLGKTRLLMSFDRGHFYSCTFSWIEFNNWFSFSNQAPRWHLLSAALSCPSKLQRRKKMSYIATRFTRRNGSFTTSLNSMFTAVVWHGGRSARLTKPNKKL